MKEKKRFNRFGIPRISYQVTRVLQTIDWTWRMILAKVFLFFVYLKIDLKLEAESLQSNFVNSKTFKKAVNDVFDECDLSQDNALDMGEFFCAILLLFHKLDRLPYTGKKNLPTRTDVHALFYKYVTAQTAAEAAMGIEKSGTLPTISISLKPKKEQNDIISPDMIKTAPIRQNNHSRQVLLRKYFRLILQKMKATGPYLAATMFYIFFEVFSLWFGYIFNQPIDTRFFPYLIRGGSAILSTSVLLILYHTHEIKKGRIMNKQPSMKTIVTHERDMKISEIKREPFRKGKLRKRDNGSGRKASTILKEDFILEKVGGSFMRRETFVYLCQTHFSSFVVSESWRVLWKALLIPIASWQLKKVLDNLISFIVITTNRSLDLDSPIEIYELPLSVVVSLTMAIFAVVIEPVNRSIMWSKLHETIKQDMMTDLINRRNNKRENTGIFDKIKTYFNPKAIKKERKQVIKNKHQDKTVGKLMRRMGEDESVSRISIQRKRTAKKTEAKDKVENMVGLDKWGNEHNHSSMVASSSRGQRNRTRVLSKLERENLKEFISSQLEVDGELAGY